MTIGHLLEALVGKAGALSGTFGDGTAFQTGNVRADAEATLTRLGYHRHGEEVLYNPHTGARMNGSVFLAPTFYQRLKHMVSDKARPPVSLFLRALPRALGVKRVGRRCTPEDAAR